MSQPAWASDGEPSRWGIGLGVAAGGGSELTPPEGRRPIEHDSLSGMVGLTMRTGRSRSFFSYRLGVDFWLGRLDLQGGGPDQQPEEPNDEPDDGSILDDILNPGGGGGSGEEPGDQSSDPAHSNQNFKGLLTSHGFMFRPDGGNLAFGLSLYAGRIYATSPEHGGDAGSYPVGLGATLLYDGQVRPGAGMPSVELSLRELRGLEIEQGSTEPAMRQREAVLRGIWFFGR